MTLTIEITTQDAPRLSEAFGSILNLTDQDGKSRPATGPEIEEATAQWLGGQTHDYEKRKNMQEFAPPPFTTTASKGKTRK